MLELRHPVVASLRPSRGAVPHLRRSGSGRARATIVTVALVLPLAGAGCGTVEGADEDGTTGVLGGTTSSGASGGTSDEADITIDPGMLNLPVGGSLEVQVHGMSAGGLYFPNDDDTDDDLSPRIVATPTAGLELEHDTGRPVASGLVVPLLGGAYAETFVVTCGPGSAGAGEVSFVVMNEGVTVAEGSLLVECEPNGDTTTGESTSGDPSTDSEGETDGEGPIRYDLYCTAAYEPQVHQIDLSGPDPGIDTRTAIGVISTGAVVPGDSPTFVAGAFPERGEPGFYRYPHWRILEEPEGFIAHPAPNQFGRGCPSSAGVLFTSGTVDSVVCDFDAGTCTAVNSPGTLGACYCEGSDCVAGGGLGNASFYISVDGGATFTDNGAQSLSQIAGDDSGFVFFRDGFMGVVLQSQDGGATLQPAAVPGGFETIEAMVAVPQLAIGARPFTPGELAVTRDQGESWATEPFSDDQYPRQIVRTTGGDLAAWSDAGTFHMWRVPFDEPWVEFPAVSLNVEARCYGG